LIGLCAAPALAAGLRISPPSVEFDVPSDGSSQVEFLVYDFTGELQISLEDIPLTVEPTTVPVTAKEEGTRVILTLYGDESLGSKIYQGKIRFLAMTGGSVAMGIKVRATINHIASGQPLLEVTSPVPEEALPESPSEEATAPPEQAPTTTELPILLLAGIAAGTAIIITLIVVLARRRRY
ncbi:unnamed protein product, partial [marine sediment metagenome]